MLLPATDLIESFRFTLSCAGKTDHRRYINSVYVSDARIVSTDGHRLAVVHLRSADPDADWIFTRDSVERAVKMFSRPGDGVATLTGSSLTIGDVTLPMTLEEGKYPPVGRVDEYGRNRTPAPLIGLNADYITEAGKACRRLANRKYHGVKMHVGDTGQTVIFEPNIVAEDFPSIEKAYIQIMPMRLA